MRAAECFGLKDLVAELNMEFRVDFRGLFGIGPIGPQIPSEGCC